ncbi:MAG: FadR family transcriptional regulator [Phycisphaerae bacterium]|nr:FadR family transcriptional regulator [Phycisphaerae bacterium]
MSSVLSSVLTLNVEKTETLVERIAQELIRYIAANRLKPGDRLPSERELMAMAGVSRLPLREAICMLKGLGILEARHGKGIFLNPIDIASLFGMLSPLLRTHADINISHIVEARYHLEASAAELAALNRTDENLETLRTHLQGMRQHLNDVPAFTENDMAFHQELATSTRNPIFEAVMATIADLLGEVLHMYPDNLEDRQTSLHYHERILEAVEAGDAPLARSVMQEHIRDAGDKTLRRPEVS